MRGLHPSSGNTELTDSRSQSLTTLRVHRLFFSTPSTAYMRALKAVVKAYSAVFHKGSVIGLYRKLHPAINRSIVADLEDSAPEPTAIR